jgi:hypothetical protein
MTWLRRCFSAVPLLTLALAFVSPSRVPAQSVDAYGGYVDLPSRDGATGFFRIEKNGTRWTFVSPSGNKFWMRAVYAITWGDGGNEAFTKFQTKYGSDNFKFTEHANNRLKAWGFNAVGPYSLTYALPVPTNFQRSGNAVKLPYVGLLNVSWYGALKEPNTDLAKWGLAPGPFKTLLAGAVDPAIYTGWPGHVPDVFDPNFESFGRNLAADIRTPYRTPVFTEKTSFGGAPNPSLVDSPWRIGTAPDDVDFFFGLGGPGPEVPGIDGVIHPHLGWIVAVTRPTQTQNTSVGVAFGLTQTVTYSDPVVYTKQAWRNFLAAKYGSIEALNASWGSTYTTFDSDGGWPSGNGLMDENGRHAWLKDFNNANQYGGPVGGGTFPNVKADLDAFLEFLADRYFSVVTGAVRASMPNHLVFGPAMLNGHKGLSRREILRAAGRHCDVIEINHHPDKPELISITYAETGGKPLFSWVGMYANPDSSMYAYPNPSATGFTTQAERGTRYEQLLNSFLTATAANGDQPVIGLAWWEYMDKWGEKANWGLVTPRDNAYDGVEATTNTSVDPWGYPAGGEDRNYGNFLSHVITAHAGIPGVLAPPPPPPALTVAITQPTPGTVQGSVTVAASGSSTATRVELLLDGSLVATVNDAAATYTWDTTTAANGPHQWVAKAYDNFGQTATSSAVDVTVNNPVPPPPLSVTITQPTSGTTVKGTVTVAVASSTATSIDLMFDGVVVDRVAGASASYEWDTTAVTNGLHRWTAEASDDFGQTAESAPVDVTVSNPPPPDTTPPVVTLVEPINAVRKAKVTLTATASDAVGVVKVEFYVNTTVQCTDTTAPYTCVWTVSNAGKTYVLQAKAYDAAGNVGVSQKVTVVPK